MTITKLGTLMEALRKDVMSIAEAISGLVSSHASMDKRLGRLDDDMAVVKPAVTGLLTNVAEIKPLVQTTAKDLAELKTDVKDHLARVDDRLSALESKPG